MLTLCIELFSVAAVVVLCHGTCADITTCQDYPEEHVVLITLANRQYSISRKRYTHGDNPLPENAVEAYKELAEGDYG